MVILKEVKKVDNQGKITIPKKIREELEIEKGDNLVIVFKEKRIEIFPLKQALKNEYMGEEEE